MHASLAYASRHASAQGANDAPLRASRGAHLQDLQRGNAAALLQGRGPFYMQGGLKRLGMREAPVCCPCGTRRSEVDELSTALVFLRWAESKRLHIAQGWHRQPPENRRPR
jgi:hypothetical protein